MFLECFEVTFVLANLIWLRGYQTSHIQSGYQPFTLRFTIPRISVSFVIREDKASNWRFSSLFKEAPFQKVYHSKYLCLCVCMCINSNLWKFQSLSRCKTHLSWFQTENLFRESKKNICIFNNFFLKYVFWEFFVLSSKSDF